MAKVIRKTYPVELSVGLLLLVFSLTFFLSGQVFDKHHVEENAYDLYFGMFLVAVAVVMMMLVLWEEFLFPVRIKPEGGGFVFRNHRNKLKKQLLIYLVIPVIFVFLYFNFALNHVRFFIWAGICIGLPVAGKLISGLNNYNDYLKLTDEAVEYKNNEKEGVIGIEKIKDINLIRDQRKVLHKIELQLVDNTVVLIDIDEMELESFYAAIDDFVTSHYRNKVRGTTA